MSLLDIDERLLEIADQIDVVYSPLVDAKQFPEDVDVTLVEGAIGSVEDLKRIETIRQRTRVLVSLGDCAVTANVPGMNNSFGIDSMMKRVYEENATHHPQIPNKDLPALLPKTQPLHEVVKVDVFVPGCPPSADTIFYALTELLAGRLPDLNDRTRFGA
jgi:NAD-reducing hydrogenase small subunit